MRVTGRMRTMGIESLNAELRLAHERAGEHFVHPRDRNDLKTLLDALVDLGEILGVLLRDQHRFDATALRRQQLLP